MNKQLKPNVAILLICYIHERFRLGSRRFGRAVWAPVLDRAETLGSHQSNFYFIKALFSWIQLLFEKSSF